MNQSNFEDLNNKGHESLDLINELGHKFFGEILSMAVPLVNNVTRSNIDNSNTPTKISIKVETVKDDEKELILLAYIPGVEKENVDITIKCDMKTLVIAAQTSIGIQNEKKYYREYNTGIDVNNENLNVKCMAGILKININKINSNDIKVNVN